MSKLQQDFWHPLFYFIHKDGLSTYDTTATPSDALPHNTNQTGLGAGPVQNGGGAPLSVRPLASNNCLTNNNPPNYYLLFACSGCVF